MKKCLGAVLLVAFASTSAFAGTVTFTPSPVPASPGETVQMQMSVSADTLTNWDAINFIVGSDELNIVDIAWSADMTDNQSFPPTVFPDAGIYGSDIFAGIFLSSGVQDLGLGSDVVIGTVSVELPQGVDAGFVRVDAGIDAGTSQIGLGADVENITGAGEVTPEPATLGLLGLGGLAALRRRKKA